MIKNSISAIEDDIAEMLFSYADCYKNLLLFLFVK